MSSMMNPFSNPRDESAESQVIVTESHRPGHEGGWRADWSCSTHCTGGLAGTAARSTAVAGWWSNGISVTSHNSTPVIGSWL